MSWFVYIIQSKNGSLYTGVTTDYQRRYRQHEGSLSGGAKFFRGNPPKKLIYLEKYLSRSSAQKREFEIKSLSRKKKLDLTNHQRKNRVPFDHRS